MSSLSSISSYYYNTLLNTQNTSASKTDSSTDDTNDLLLALLSDDNTQTNIDGDTFKLSSSTSASNSNISYDFRGNSSDSIRSFLDKVKNGTVTASDLESMKTTLTQIPQGPPPINNSSSASDSQDVIGSFLNKVKDGTVTESDLTNIQTLLNQN